MDQQRGHIDELGGHIHVEVFQGFHIRQILRSDPGDRNVIDVDVLLANEIKEQIEGAIVDLANGDRKRRLLGLFLLLLFSG